MKVALLQLNPVVGDLAGNAEKLQRAIAEARERGADLIASAELAVCGYPPRDLLLSDGFVRRSAETARRLGESCSDGVTLVLGAPMAVERDGGKHIANALVVYRDGEVVWTYHKRLLPTYDVFDEDRYFEPGERAAVVEVCGRKVGLAICEDLWRGEDAGFASRYAGQPDPVKELVDAGAGVIISPSASPYIIGKAARHQRILRGHAERHGVWVCSVNQIGGNDDLIFDGHSSVHAPGGTLAASARGFEEQLLIADVGGRGTPEASGCADIVSETPSRRMAWDALTLGVRDYLGKCGFSRAIIGLSGGIDSALTAAIAVRALGAGNVLGVSMPGPFSSEGSVTDAFDLAQRLGMRCVKVPIARPMDGFGDALNAVFTELGERTLGESLPDLTQENLQSRARGTVLMALSNRTGALVLTTGNKSELAVGYCTLYGDMNGGLAVLSDVPKTLVYDLSRYGNAYARELGFAREPIPVSTIEKPPSAELAPDQLDSDSLPDYEVLDRIVELHVEEHLDPAQIIAESAFEPAVVERVCRLIDRNEYKRQQMAVGLKVTSRAFGAGRRMPIAWRRG